MLQSSVVVTEPQAKMDTKTSVTLPVSSSQNLSESQQARVDLNPYLGIVVKRLRTLKKRLAKIEKYEEDLAKGATKLNEDQRQAVAKKDEVVLLIKEFEEVMKIMEDKDNEEQKALKKKKRAEAIQKQKTDAEVAAAFQEKLKQDLKTFLELVYVSQFSLPSIPSDVVTGEHRDSLRRLAQSITGLGYDGDVPEMGKFIEDGLKVLSKFLEQSEENAVLNVSFKTANEELQKIVSFILNPPNEPTFTVDDKVEVSSLEVEQNSEAHLQSEYVQSEYGGSEQQDNKLSFMTTSHILEDPAIVTSVFRSNGPAVPAFESGTKLSFQQQADDLQKSPEQKQAAVSWADEEVPLTDVNVPNPVDFTQGSFNESKKAANGYQNDGQKGERRYSSRGRGGGATNGGQFRGGRGRGGGGSGPRGGFRGDRRPPRGQGQACRPQNSSSNYQQSQQNNDGWN